MAESIGNLHAGDIAVIVGYFVVVMIVGIWSSCRNRGSVGGYFLAGRSMHWIPVGASLFASNIGSGHFVGLAGSGAASGVAIAGFEINAIFILLLLGWFFVPVYMAANVFTMPEYLRKRFGGQRIRVYLSVLALLLYIFTKIAADLFSGTIFIYQSLRINFYVAVVILLVIAATFTIAGGLTAVIWTDTIQTVIMLIGAVILSIMGFIKVGGYQKLVDGFFTAIAKTTVYANTSSSYRDCGVPLSTSMNMVRPADDPSGLPWPGMFIGAVVLSVWYWCSDQVIVQRALSAKNYSHVKAGCVLAGWLKFLPMWIMVFPGMIARVLYPDEIGCADADACKEFCDQENGCTNSAYPTLVVRIMPAGLRGLMLAVMLSALMSSLTSVFNSASTLFTLDIWRLIRKNSSEVELMIVGRVFVLVLVGVSVAWMPLLQNVPELFHYIQQITSFLSPPICAVYVLAICWKRINEKGAFWGLMIGLVVGLSRFIGEYAYKSAPPCGEERETPLPDIFGKVSYLHFAIILWGVVAAATIAISLLTEPIDPKYLVRLTFFDRFNKEKRIDIDSAERPEVNGTSEKTGKENEAYVASKDDVSISEMEAATNREEPKLPCYRVAINYICGIEAVEQRELTPEEMEEIEKKNTSIHEDPYWAKFLNTNAIVLITIATFYWAFYG